MRPTVELLQLVIDRIKDEKNISFSGLCFELFAMEYANLINVREYWILYDTIIGNKPKEIILEKNNRYWWPSTLREPRIKFIESLIEKYKN